MPGRRLSAMTCTVRTILSRCNGRAGRPTTPSCKRSAGRRRACGCGHCWPDGPGWLSSCCKGVRGRRPCTRQWAGELGSPTGSIGVGGRCDTPSEIPRSFQEALRALEVRQRSQSPHGTTTFDELGLYRILGPGGSYRDVEQFVREWLGPLLDYDAAHHSDLVQTLSAVLRVRWQLQTARQPPLPSTAAPCATGSSASARSAAATSGTSTAG